MNYSMRVAKNVESSTHASNIYISISISSKYVNENHNWSVNIEDINKGYSFVYCIVTQYNCNGLKGVIIYRSWYTYYWTTCL